MIILSFDTATQGCSVAVSENEFLIAGFSLYKKETHSKHLMSMMDNVLSVSGLTLSEIDGFAVTRGPGSFTGLRIGLSTVKGLADVTGKPVVSVSSLDALAFGLEGFSCSICPMIDARKGEVYTALYQYDSGILTRKTEELAVEPGVFLESINDKTMFVGSGAITYRQIISEKASGYVSEPPGHAHHISAHTIASLSFPRFLRGDVETLSSLEPHYIRKSDAELNLNS